MKVIAVFLVLPLAIGCNFQPAEGKPVETPPKKPVAATRQFAVPVLMYHRINDLDETELRSPLLCDLRVSPADFEKQVDFLVDNGYSLLLASEVESAVKEGRELPEKAVCITLDDGYKDNFEYAFPILLKYKVPATVFLVTNNFGRTNRLSWSDVLEVRTRAGFGYGSHTVHHYDLTSLDQSTLDYELAQSKRLIEFKIQDRVTSIAYPAGSYNDFVKERARAAGYVAGWKKGCGLVTPEEDMLMLPRVRVSGRTSIEDFQRKIRATS
jgi:peptidoglycan/xylan/chitin deacetylase (PgdA/CDA1 family)